MFLQSLSTYNYRNLAGDILELQNGINLLYGKNAAGKTNTLECAYMFASGRSFRTRHEAELIKHGEAGARADISLVRDARNEHMSLIWTRGGESRKSYTKRMLYEGYEVSKASEFLGIFRAVLFTPDHLSLIKGSPDERRRLLDIAISQLSPRYIHYMNEYLGVLAQKNAYLKKASFSGKVDEDYLGVLNEQLAKTGAVLIRQRSGFAGKLRSYVENIYARLSGDKESLDVKYLSVTKRDYDDVAYTEEALMAIFRADRASELRLGRTVHGPHKDDLFIGLGYKPSEIEALSESVLTDADGTPNKENLISEFAARSFGSQGQQRSAVLAIKLAEGEIFKEMTGSYPVFLFDDLLGELDADRRSFLTRLIRDRQAIISCCDRSAFPDTENVAAVHVADGRYTWSETT